MEMQSLSRHLAHSKEKDGQKKKRFSMNPLQQGIRQFLHESQSRQQHLSTSPTFVSGLPKRFTFYPPMLLLSANVFSTPDDWVACYSSLSETDRQNLYASIAEAFTKSGQTVTHIAINAPIQLTTASGHENHMRSPNGLTPLYGDFGELLDAQHSPSRQDLDQAFWVHTTQNGGIVQYWAPLYTMFSRGNITEKARILGLRERFTGLDESSLSPQTIDDISVVDLYAGIGYFVFSYLKRGVRRVWGWELNAWSVEGLRRGCLENGWQCKVIRLSHSEGHGALPSILEDKDLAELLNELTDDTRVVIFQGDNQSASEILKKLQPELERRGLWTAIRHVNLGLLPSSQQTWKPSLQLLDRNSGGWAHVHENVDVSDIETKAKYIEAEYSRLAGHLDGVDTNNLSVACDHVEKVKTYAPGVMHCVFDIQIKFEKS